MTEKETLPYPVDLRREAEKIARARAAGSPEKMGNHGDFLPQELLMIPLQNDPTTLHELRVHQVELEMQNRELHQKQEELDAARARYFDLYDLAPVGYITISKQDLIIGANLAAATMLQMVRGGLGHARPIFSQFIHSEDQEIYYRFRKQLFEIGEPQTCELRMTKKGSQTFLARLQAIVAQYPATASPRLRAGQAGEAGQAGPADEPVIRVVISDISAEQNLKEANNLLEQMVEERTKQLRQETETPPAEGDDTVLLVDDEPHVLSALTRALRNPGYEVLTAGSASQALAILLTTKIKVIVADEKMEGMKGSELLAEVRQRFPHTVRILLSGHATLEIAMRAVNEGGIYRFLAKPWDDALLRLALSAATEKYNMEDKNRKLQDALRQSEERYRTVVEQSPQAVVVRRDLEIIYANPAAVKLFGATSLRDLAGSPVLDRIHPDDRQAVMKRAQKVMKDGVGVPMIEMKYLKLDGTVIDGEAQGTPIIYDGLPAIHLAINDITERKQAEEYREDRKSVV